VLLNLSPDHQDRYASPEAYYQAKCRIFMNQGPSDHALLNRDDPEVRRLESTAAARVHPFSRTEDAPEGACVKGGDIVMRRKGLDVPVIPLEAMPLHGAHNIDNVLAAVLIADLAGVPMPRVAQALRTFTGLPHRLEKVRDLDGVAYFNDSKATNVGATIRSVQSFESQVVLILGGKDKGGRFEALRPLISQRVSHMILMGEARDTIEAQIRSTVPIHQVGTMTEAVAVARTVASAGSVVLLAPACASFDQYSGFAERGEDFRRKVLALTGDASRAPAPRPREG
jgi:UDP-N-acetylmuramoylalanine--D-glutamate ligase